MTPEQLRQCRGDRTRNEFAAFLNCSASAIVQWEGGDRAIPAWVEEKCLSNIEVRLPIAELHALLDLARERDMPAETLLAEALRNYLGLPSKQTVIQATFGQAQPSDEKLVAETTITPPLSAEDIAKQKAGVSYATKKKRPS